MPNVTELELNFYLVVAFVILVVKIFTFVNALMFSGEAYEAAGKLTKPAWCLILGIGVAVNVLLLGSPISFLNLIFLIAALVYLADVRPALLSLTRR
ncbi:MULTISPECIES: DUF2516 family protein [Nocardioides]|uniref:DUF2516 family protein n=1 Tax=Nocardioides kribbensis TaxID=305517 RepID=A0ABV1NXL4_9ACTN|nr:MULTISPECIES: DUF2516 family protein [Nocardioides]KQQ42933.1 hypothetical protein ASF50_02660 [Nocardioides sp. Leaf307]MBJ7528235.1 DUF2516 family protein [Nocardioides sp.]